GERRRRNEQERRNHAGGQRRNANSHSVILRRVDNLTHSLFGLTLARTPLGRAGRGTTAALLLASTAPDIDVLLSIGSAPNYLRYHRGPTHGLLGIVGLSLTVAAVVSIARKRFGR